MTAFVTCAACGARIRADRSRCLRCNQPLVAAAELSAAEKLSKGQRLMISAAGSLVILLIVALAWENRPAPREEAQESVPPGATAPPSQSVPPPDAAAPSAAPAPAPGEFLDLTRAGNVAFVTGDIERAKREFESALERKPDDPDVLNSLGQALDRAGDVPGAIARFERAIELAPDRWAYHFNLAHAAGRLSQWDRAVAEYREAARLFPEDYATQFNLAMALRRQGNDAAAIPEFEKAIVLAPAEASFHVALGNSLQSVGKLAEARKAFETYLELEPTAPDAAKVKAHIEALVAASSASTAQPATPTPGS